MHTRVMTLNCGSSSVKYALFDMPEGVRLCQGIVDRINIGDSFIEHFTSDNCKFKTSCQCRNHTSAVDLILDLLTEKEAGVIDSLSEIIGVGHRVVHGGMSLIKPVIINNDVLEIISECSALAPLHNPANLQGIKAITELMPDAVQVAVFDTAFFASLPQHVFLYAVPYEWYEKYHIRKYGFHGISHRYLAGRAAVLMGKKLEETNTISFHIGNGVSVTAVKGGSAFDHSMGFTPMEGAVMGTRCGDIDPGIPLYIMRQEQLECQEMENILNKRSGLLGISGKFTDRRDILASMKAGDPRAKLSFDIECYRLRKYVGAYMAAMGKVDVIVFSGGVGENSPLHREKICEGLQFLGIELDPKKNELAVGGNNEEEISAVSSPVKLYVVPTDEARVIAEDTFALL